MVKLPGILSVGLLAGLAACRQEPAPEAPKNEIAAPAPVSAPAPPPAPTPALKPAIDPKSREAASELVRGLVDALNEGRFGDAWMLLGPNAPPRPEFERRFTRYSGLKVTAGAAGDEEGAAGSIYLSVPLTVSGSVDGTQVSDRATAILRRVNDVPGSTEEQRHWHIERIDWGS
jgi:hypothetical protein